jgi:hypothetical protein
MLPQVAIGKWLGLERCSWVTHRFRRFVGVGLHAPDCNRPARHAVCLIGVDQLLAAGLDSPATKCEGQFMLRFTIRELLILTVTAGLAVGWWLEHRANAANTEAVEDARFLAQYAANSDFGVGDCSTVSQCVELQRKYGAVSPCFDPAKWKALDAEIKPNRRAASDAP